uniref:Chitin-binding type-2 domain-containing protein n=1 Tax=Rhabditophanes sp. KR3021 TaxID=114890 RepID=A0AC35TRA2_9BILA
MSALIFWYLGLIFIVSCQGYPHHHHNHTIGGSLTSVSLDYLCFGEDFTFVKNFGLGPCNSDYVECNTHIKKAIFRKCRIGLVYAAGKCVFPTKVKECFDTQIGSKMLALKQLAKEVDFCNQGPGYYFSPPIQSQCPNEKIVCSDDGKAIPMVCSNGQNIVVDKHGRDRFVCLANGYKCYHSQAVEPITLSMVGRYCSQRSHQLNGGEIGPNNFYGHPKKEGRKSCQNWFVDCQDNYNGFGQARLFCPIGQIYDESRRTCRVQNNNDYCLSPQMCSNQKMWTKIQVAECTSSYIFCQFMEPVNYNCDHSHVMSEGKCISKLQAPTCPKTESPPKPEQINCKGITDYSLSCSVYMVCVGGRFYQRSCPHLFKWDSQSKNCIRDDGCRKHDSKVCNEGEMIASLDCKYVDKCYNGYFVKKNCEGDKVNSQERSLCHQCKLMKDPTAYYPKGKEIETDGVVGQTSDANYYTKEATCEEESVLIGPTCGDYLRCYYGAYVIETCAYGHSFNVQKRICEAGNGNCQSANVEAPNKHPQKNDNSYYYPPPEPVNPGPYDPFYETASQPIFITNEYSLPCLSTNQEIASNIYDCTKFFKCDRQRQIYASYKCPEGTFFDIDLRNHNHCSRTTTCHSSSECVDGTMLTTTDCDKFKVCKDNRFKSRRCDKKSQFNGFKCDFNVECELGETDPRPDRNCKEGVMIPHTHKCDRFYQCEHGENSIKECVKGKVFDPVTQRCTSRLSACTLEANSHRHCMEGEIKNIPSIEKALRYAEKGSYHLITTLFMKCVDGEFVTIQCKDNVNFEVYKLECMNYFPHSTPGHYHTTTPAPYQYSFDWNRPCTEAPDHKGFHYDPRDCKKFFQCAHDRWVPKDCAPVPFLVSSIYGHGQPGPIHHPSEYGQPGPISPPGYGQPGPIDPPIFPPGPSYPEPALPFPPNHHHHEGTFVKHNFHIKCGHRDHKVVVNLHDCSQYYKCSRHNHSYDLFQCPKGTNFDRKHEGKEGRYCSHHARCHRYGRCHGGDIILMVNCGRYKECVNGRFKGKVCDKNRWFDGNECVRDEFCEEQEATCKEGVKVEDKDNCKRFFVCEDGKKILKQCSRGRGFDAFQQRCTKELNSCDGEYEVYPEPPPYYPSPNPISPY